MLGYAEDPGVTPRAIQHVLTTVSISKTRQYLVRVSYVEIYNDKIRDLQNPGRTDLSVREDKAGRVFIDAEETIVESFEEAMAVLEKGQAARHVGETKMNARSSRSHTVFTLQIESKGGDGIDKSFRASSLNLVDLAGSERLKSTGAEGTRQKEGAHINKSLLVLGTIINRLSSSGGDTSRIGHLPYRDSKLTRLLQPALGGNAKTAVLCAITPSGLHVEETISTLKFAARAKKVTNNAVRNEIVDYRSKYKEAATEVVVLRERFAALEAEVAAIRGERGPGNANGGANGHAERPAVQPSSAEDTAKIIALSVDLHGAQEEVTYLKGHVDEMEAKNEHLQEQLKAKAVDFRRLHSRAVELRSAARKARLKEHAVRRTVMLSYRKLEEARGQLDISRKKGAHVKVAEMHLEELSTSLKAWLPSGHTTNNCIGEVSETETVTPPGSEMQEEGETRMVPHMGIGLDMLALERGRRRSTLHSREGSVDEGSSVQSSPMQRVRRRPRPLPEDMVADIDDSEAETADAMPLDDDDLQGLEEDEEFTAPVRELRMRASDRSRDGRDVSSGEKPKKKPKGWKALRNFYGYANTQQIVFDKLMGGHKVPSTGTHIST